MPPRHITRPPPSAIRHAASLRFGFVTLCLLLFACCGARVHAQPAPPGATPPADPFHQPCVAVRGSPGTSSRDAFGTRRASAAPRIAAMPPATARAVRKQYVDLDNRCATPPAFAPTRNIDSTSVWYVDALEGRMHARAQRSGVRALRALRARVS